MYLTEEGDGGIACIMHAVAPLPHRANAWPLKFSESGKDQGLEFLKSMKED